MSQHMSPLDTLQMVNEVFSRFDMLVDRFGLEKIKTIGDAYMLAGGLPTPMNTHAEDVARMAMAMQEEIKQVRGPEAGATGAAHRHRHRSGGGRRDRAKEVPL